MVPDVGRVIGILREVADAEILPRFRRLGAGDVAAKSRPSDLVTTADIEAERRLGEALTRLSPESVVVGEEAAETDPSRLRALAGARPVWLIDPVDGTHNFAHGTAPFAVICAYCQGGETVAGWILDPLAGEVAWAVRDRGAYLTCRDGAEERISVSPPRLVAEMRGSLGFRLERSLKDRRRADAGPRPAAIVRSGSTGRDYMDLGRGSLDFARYARLKPWDHAAGVLIHAEAGGFSLLTGTRTPYRPEPRILEATLLIAPDAASWRALEAVFESAADSDFVA